MLHLIRKVSPTQLPMKQNCFKVETSSKEYIMQVLYGFAGSSFRLLGVRYLREVQ